MRKEADKINKIEMIIIHSLIPLLLGGFIYVLFRSKTLRMFEWFYFIGLEEAIQAARTAVVEFKKYLPVFACFSLPDGLWLYSFTSAILIYWRNDKQRTRNWLLIPLASGIFVEIMQGFKLFPGTFDYLDLAFLILGFSSSILIINHQFTQNEKTVS